MIDVRPARDGDLDALGALRVQGFGLAPAAATEFAAEVRDAGRSDRVLVAWEQGRIIGGLDVLPFGQFWLGRPVPTGGLGSVVIAPEDRGHGVGRALLAAACAAMRERGEALSVLDPAAVAVYRGAGWEIAGTRSTRAVAAADLAALPPTGLRERPATDADHDAIKRVYVRAASARNGMLARPASVWTRRLAARAGRYCYVVERAATLDTGDGRGTTAAPRSSVCGYAIYSQQQRPPMPGYQLRVEDLATTDWDAEATLWRHLGAHRAQVADVVCDVPLDAVALHLAEPRLREVWTRSWMLRAVDVAGAVRARGFPPGLHATVRLTISDPLVVANGGDWVLDVSDGHGELVRAHESGVALTVNAFAALYAGCSARLLAAADVLRGATLEQLAALDAAFAGPRAVFNDDF